MLSNFTFNSKDNGKKISFDSEFRGDSDDEAFRGFVLGLTNMDIKLFCQILVNWLFNGLFIYWYSILAFPVFLRFSPYFEAYSFNDVQRKQHVMIMNYSLIKKTTKDDRKSVTIILKIGANLFTLLAFLHFIIPLFFVVPLYSFFLCFPISSEDLEGSRGP